MSVVGGVNPNGVVSRRPNTQSPVTPSGHNPVGVGGHRRGITQGWRCANPGLCYTTPLGLELPAPCQLDGRGAGVASRSDMGNTLRNDMGNTFGIGRGDLER